MKREQTRNEDFLLAMAVLRCYSSTSINGTSNQITAYGLVCYKLSSNPENIKTLKLKLKY
jgi:hypothetical protein